MNYLKIIFIYIGLIIGAGFASGREICVYFNFCSNNDFTGIAIATILFIFVCFIILKKSVKYELYNISDYIKQIFSFSKLLQGFFMCLIFFDLVCGLIVMLSSCGELIQNLLNTPKIIGTIILAVSCFIVIIFDVKGIAVINIILVPIITLIITFICIFSILTKIYSPTFSNIIIGTDRNIIFLSICYVSYNTLTAASVLSPIAKTIHDKRTILLSSFAAGTIIGILIFLVWFAIGQSFGSLWYESFPLQKLAANINNNFKYIYSLCLIFSIFTTTVSEGYGILSYFKINNIYKRAAASIIMFILIIPFSMISFSYLIKNLYFILGSLGMLWMLILLIDYLREIKV